MKQQREIMIASCLPRLWVPLDSEHGHDLIGGGKYQHYYHMNYKEDDRYIRAHTSCSLEISSALPPFPVP